MVSCHDDISFIVSDIGRREKMSIKVKSQQELMLYDDSKEEYDDGLDAPNNESRCGPVRKKRQPACLSILCPVCGGPAPDHMHFGGKLNIYYKQETRQPIGNFFESFQAKSFNGHHGSYSLIYFPQGNVAIPAEHSSAGQLRELH